jgi:hypothetical protein
VGGRTALCNESSNSVFNLLPFQLAQH